MSQTDQSEAEKLKREAKKTAEQALESTEEVVADAKQKGQELVEEGKDKAQEFIHQQQQFAATQADGVAKALRKTADQLDDDQAWLTQGIGQAANALENTAGQLRDKDIRSLASQLEDFTRRQPAVVLGGAVAVGFLLSRFLKSSADRDDHNNRNDQQPTTGV